MMHSYSLARRSELRLDTLAATSFEWLARDLLIFTRSPTRSPFTMRHPCCRVDSIARCVRCYAKDSISTVQRRRSSGNRPSPASNDGPRARLRCGLRPRCRLEFTRGNSSVLEIGSDSHRRFCASPLTSCITPKRNGRAFQLDRSAPLNRCTDARDARDARACQLG